MRGIPRGRRERGERSFPDFAEIDIALSSLETLALTTVPISDAQEIELWALARLREQDPLHVAALMACWNHAVPTIHRRLPIELLTHILVLTGREWRSIRALRLLHVSRHWRSVVLQASEFWADMFAVQAVYYKPELVEILLRHSGSRLIQITSRLSRQSLLAGVYKEILAPHFHRISYLQAPVGLTDEELHSLLFRGQFASLQTLHLSSQRSLNGKPLRSLMNDPSMIETALPSLRELESPPELLPYFVTQTLQKLTVLSPSDFSPEGAQTSRSVALARCSRHLRQLTVTFARHTFIAWWFPPGDVPPLRFVVLEHLKLLFPEADSAVFFLEHVEFPPSTRLTIKFLHDSSGPLSAVQERMRHLLPDRLARSTVDGADRLHIRTYSGTMRLKYDVQTFQGGRELLAVQQESRNISRDVHRVFLGVPSITTLRLTIAVPGDVPDLPLVLDALPRLTHLQLGPIRFRPFNPYWNAHLIALASPAPSSGAVVCPSLEELTVVKERRDMIDVEKAEGETADVIAPVLEERQKQLGHSLRSFVVSFIPGLYGASSTQSYGADAALGIYTERLSHCVQDIRVTTLCSDSCTL